MKIAVTGGNGDLGKVLVPYLVEQGHSVVSIDRTLPQGWGGPNLRYWVANTLDFGEFVGSLQGCDALIHLAAIRSPVNHPDHVVYNENTVGSYNALSASALLGIKRVCLASSINAIGSAFSRNPRFDYLPLDEKHPTHAEDPYSLSKWVMEQQGDAFARRYEDMSIASLRFHWLLHSYERAHEFSSHPENPTVIKHLWAYTLLSEAARACLLAVTADFKGHHVFYIVAPDTAVDAPSLELAQKHFPDAELRDALDGHKGFYDCSKAEKILGWTHVSHNENH